MTGRLNCGGGDDLRQPSRAVAHLLPTDTCQNYPNLAAVVEAWSELPEAIRVGLSTWCGSTCQGNATQTNSTKATHGTTSDAVVAPWPELPRRSAPDRGDDQGRLAREGEVIVRSLLRDRSDRSGGVASRGGRPTVCSTVRP